LTRVASLEPKAHEVIVCVGDSEDDTERIVHTKFPEFLVVRSKRGRSTQMNAGADVAGGDVFFFLHADTFVPSDVVSVIRRAMLLDARVVCGGFVSLIETQTKTYWGMSLHNVLKTYYTPLLVKPLSFARGLRCLFGDQAMFADAACFRSVSGFDEALPIMEDADLCLRLHESGWVRGSNGVAARRAHGDGTRRSGATETATRANAVPALTCAGMWEDVEDENDDQVKKKRFRKTTLAPKAVGSNLGRIVLVNRVVTTSGRRIEGLGNVKATLTHFLIGVSWYCGADPDAMVALYRKFYPPANP
jgi:glycosyltransferase involved in cell wall biosynthesis